MNPCWIIHEPRDGGSIVSAKWGPYYMFCTEVEAVTMLCQNYDELPGYVCQKIHDAEGFQQAANADGYGAVWFDADEACAYQAEQIAARLTGDLFAGAVTP